MSAAIVSRLAGAKLRAARARFAESLGDRRHDSILGSIVLRLDQLDAIRRVRAALDRDGGCLLADDPGSGKTYVALAVAREWSSPLIVVPASLQSTWYDALRRAGARGRMITHEALSRGILAGSGCDGIIVDESHRFRPTSRRHAALARIATSAPVLLLSATPLQNRSRELAAQLALFLGESAYRMHSTELARYVVRGESSKAVELPRVAPPRWLTVRADDGEVLRAILALPPPPRAIDVGDGGALLMISLVRAWASSRAALLATVRRRRRTLVAIEQCFGEGRAPTRQELRAWTGGDGVQLGFASLLASSSVDRAMATNLAASLTAERHALDALQARLVESDDPDVDRAAALRRLRVEHPGASILAFSESASTIGAYFRALRSEPRVGMLTARDARIASGRISRTALLSRFAPSAQGVRAPPERECVTLLLSTDLLSEGVNLQDASVVVHLDLPWNPARLAQRLGRVRRPGGAMEVFSYLMTPPAETSLVLRAESRLRAKLARAERTIGRGLDVMPVLDLTSANHIAQPDAPDFPTRASDASMSEAELRGAIDGLIASWARVETRCMSATHRTRCIIAGVVSDVPGWLAVLDDGRVVTRLAAEAGPCRSFATLHHVTECDRGVFAWAESDVASVERAVRLALGDPRSLSERELRTVVLDVAACVDGDWARASCGDDAVPSAPRRALRRRLAAELLAVPRHRRAHVSALAARALALLDAPMPLGIERSLSDLSEAREASVECRGERWISAALALLERSPARASRLPARRAEAVAIIVFGPGQNRDDVE